MSAAIDYSMLSPALRGGMQRYIEQRLRPGDFLLAVLSNDLRAAVFAADVQNAAALTSVVRWLYHEAPSQCHGSPANVMTWLLKDGS